MEPSTMGMIPFAGINSCFKLAGFAYHLSEVGPESQVFVRLIHIVRIDLQETERLLSVPAVKRRVGKTPGKIPWIMNALQNNRISLNEIGRWVEDARVDHLSKGKLDFGTRVRWVLEDHDKVMKRQVELAACHQQLSNVLAYLIPLEDDLAGAALLPAIGENLPYDVVVAPRQRRTSQLSKQKSHCQILEKTSVVEAEKPSVVRTVPDARQNDDETYDDMFKSFSLSPNPKLHSVYNGSNTSPYKLLTPPPSYTSVNNQLPLGPHSRPRTRSAETLAIMDGSSNFGASVTDVSVYSMPRASTDSTYSIDTASGRPPTSQIDQRSSIPTNPPSTMFSLRFRRRPPKD
ncbi:hypothetical protein BU24DRAFT_495261 [Aaosphaeria arxii CBS 175.79]|uniref:Uncharacterized protein n=1 Tax=Aaosphaeria arxii CBS 175.79 TaxID=1450172 RepID=A0A6A5XH51_9PLEO|nr:uncharacterized protein BU24DRAFT_495261 [Aaosphaeria arxii CBS 175.79]KAF2012199.1 hypothetical protein BU24DRAFT_495261 [Aaosphaeria arxii CBS 175.79]